MDPALLHACDFNYWLSDSLFFGCSLKGEVVETHDLHLASCGFASAQFNGAFLKKPEGDLPAAIARAEAYFERLELPFAFNVRSDWETLCAPALRDAGYEPGARVPAMVLDPARDEKVEIAGLEIAPVRSPEELVTFQETAFAGFGLPGQLGSLFLTEQLMAAPGVELYLGRVDGAPVATSCLVPSTGVAGVYWVATLEAHRGRGLGEALTWAAVRGGLTQGCAVASLQASEVGEPVYARMGFETPVQYRKYGPPSDAEGA
jgi:GNAT superfamily N-acetyltransferase